MEKHHYSTKELQYIIDNYPTMTSKELGGKDRSDEEEHIQLYHKHEKERIRHSNQIQGVE